MIKPGIYKEIKTGALEFRGEDASELPLVYERQEQLTQNCGLIDQVINQKLSYNEFNRKWADFNKI